MKVKKISLLLCASILGSLTLSPLTVNAEEKELEYKGKLEFMHFSTGEEAEANGGAEGLRTMLDEWQTEHPDIELVQNVMAHDDYLEKSAALAAAGDLPDIYMLKGSNTTSWAEQGLAMDMTDIIKNSSDAENYNMDLFYAWESDDKYYGIPALALGSATILVYNEDMWKDAGFESFPETWEEIIDSKDYFLDQGITPIAFGNGAQWNMESCFLSVVGNRFCGDEWMKSLIEKTGAKFTDEKFVEALEFTQKIFTSGIINEDFNAITNDDAREYYLDGSAAAFIGGDWDIKYMHSVLVDDPELLEKTKFVVLPQPEGATAAEGTQNSGMGWAVTINPKVAEDPAKLDAAIDLIYKITGSEYASYIAENYAFKCVTDVKDVDLSKFDQYEQDFYHYLEEPSCLIYDSYLSSPVWSQVWADLQVMTNGEMEPKEVAENAQKAYEENY